jgi:hypothetical protein
VDLFEVERESKLAGHNAAQRKERPQKKELMHRQLARFLLLPDNLDDSNVAWQTTAERERVSGGRD